MGAIATAFNDAFRDYVVPDLPSSGHHNPDKADIRAIGALIDAQYRAQIGFSAALGAGEELPLMVFDHAVSFPANLANNIGILVGTAPTANEVITLRKYLANGTDAGIVATITIHADKSISRATTGGVGFTVPQGGALLPVGDVTPQGATDLAELLIGA